MKKIITLIILAIRVASYAQTYPEPDFGNIPMWYDSSTSSLKGFERMPPNQSTRMSGIASAEVLIYFPGETSSVPFQKGKMPPFIIKMNTETEDPASTIELGKFTVNRRKHQREYIVGHGGFGGSKTTVSTIIVDFKKIGKGVYQIIPAQPLEVGEYAINIGKQGFLFSIIQSK